MRSSALVVVSLIVTTLIFVNTGTYRNNPGKVAGDGAYYYHYLVSLVYDQDIDFSNDYTRSTSEPLAFPIDPYRFREKLTDTGKPTNYWSVGPALLWFPFFVVAGVTAEIARRIGVGHLSWYDGWSFYFQYITMFSAVVYAHLGLWLGILIFQRWFSRVVSVVSLLLVFWGTNLAYYTFQEPSMSHAYDFFATTLFLFLALRAWEQQRSWSFVAWGLAGGLAILVRPQNLVMVVLVALYFLVLQVVYAKCPARKLVKNYGLAFVALLVGVMPLVFTNLYLFGDVLAIPQGRDWMQWGRPKLGAVLFSGRNGLFTHSPLLLLGLVGVFLLPFVGEYRNKKDLIMTLFVPLVIAFVAQWYLASAALDWWGGHAFGMRRLISTYLFFALGLAVLGDVLQRWLKTRVHTRKLIYALVALVAMFFVAINLYLMTIHVAGFWNYNRSHDIAYYLFRFPPDFVRYIKDRTPPVCTLVEPPLDERVRRPIRMRVEISDEPGNSGVKHVVFTTNAYGSWTVLERISNPPYEWLWDAEDVPVEQVFEVGATVIDNAGNICRTVRQVKIDGCSIETGDTVPPEAQLTVTPIRSGTQTFWLLRVQVTDPDGETDICKVRFTSNETGSWEVIGELRHPPFEMVWHPAHVSSDQSLMVGAEVFDFAGNYSTIVEPIAP